MRLSIGKMLIATGAARRTEEAPPSVRRPRPITLRQQMPVLDARPIEIEVKIADAGDPQIDSK